MIDGGHEIMLLHEAKRLRRAERSIRSALISDRTAASVSDSINVACTIMSEAIENMRYILRRGLR